MGDAYVVVGVARSRTRWFGELGRWADTAVAPIEFVKCLTGEEARAVLGAGRNVSALLLDADLPRLDRDLVGDAERAGVPTILVGDRRDRDWEALGCAARLDETFDREDLLDVLHRVARRVARPTERRAASAEIADDVEMGQLVGVVGAGGVGTSTVAIGLCQAWAGDDAGADVVLVDGCRRADLAMYHDVGDVFPGLPELVDRHRADDADPDEVRDLEFDSGRGYRLVLGLRRPRDWAALRPRAVAASIDALRRSHSAVVVDLEADLETESDTGSADVEDRHAVALAVARGADAVVVVAGSDMKGVHDGARVVHDLRRVGTPASRIVVVLNRASRSPAARSQAARALRTLTDDGIAASTSVRHLRGVEAAHRDAAPIPGAIGEPVLTLVRKAFAHPAPTATPASPPPVRIRVGELGAAAGSAR